MFRVFNEKEENQELLHVNDKTTLSNNLFTVTIIFYAQVTKMSNNQHIFM